MGTEPARDPDFNEDLDRLMRGALPGEFSFFGRQKQQQSPPLTGIEPGRVIDDFKLIAPIGQGGMGQVWEAEQVSLNRRVALKLVRPDRVNEHTLDLFSREARAGGRLHHSGIVTVYGHGEAEGVTWISMELVEGAWTLKDFIEETTRKGDLPDGYYRRVAALVAAVADALQAAHEANVIHRDIKPGNVLITPDEHPKVTDFGLAKITDETALSVTGDFAGTYAYMSPEQVAAKRIGLDHRTDIFSLGVVFYELLILQRPFIGDTSQQVGRQIMLEDPTDPRRLRSKVPRDLAVITGKCMEKHPDRRYQSMAGLADDIRRHLANEPILAKPPTAWQRAAKWVKRHPTVSGIATVGTAALAVISFLLTSTLTARQRERQATDPAVVQELIERTRTRSLWLHDGDDREWFERLDAWSSAANDVLNRMRQHEKLVKTLPAASSRKRRLQRMLAQEQDLRNRQAEIEIVREEWSDRWDWCAASLAEDSRFEAWSNVEKLAPQDGLLPLGRHVNEDDKPALWEFIVLGSGSVPKWLGAIKTGRAECAEDAGIVLVLVPGGTFWMGAQAEDPVKHNYEQAAGELASPVHRVSLEPFFISKYELTEAQWSRMLGRREERHGRLPQAGISWPDCERVLDDWSLSFPTESQWEYACRAETETRFWFGNSEEDLDRVAWWGQMPGHRHAVGELLANPFGLYDVHGNVFEWCQDGWWSGSYEIVPARPGDGLREVPAIDSPDHIRISRGGGFDHVVEDQGSAARNPRVPSRGYKNIGVRPARAITK